MSIPTGQMIKQIQELLKDEQFPEALELCNELLVQNDHGIVLHLKGIALYYLGHFLEAIETFKQATQQKEFTVESWSYLALLNLEMLNLEQAKIALLRATQISPHHADVWALRAIYREWLQDFIGAERAYSHANWLAPNTIPKLPEFQTDEIEKKLTQILTGEEENIKIFNECISIQFQKAPTISQLKEHQNTISPLFLSFHFEPHPQKGILTGFQKNIQRGLAEEIYLAEQLEPVLPEIKRYLETWYQRQP